MPQQIKIRKGLNIPLLGKAEKTLNQIQVTSHPFSIRPSDFTGLIPKSGATEGSRVLAGDVLFYDKNRPEIKITSPVSGTLKTILRGERRKILEYIIEPDASIEYKAFTVPDLNSVKRENLIQLLLDSGLWPLLRQRPFEVIANPTQTPTAIFISGFDSSPLAPDYDYILTGQESPFQKGIDVLKKLTNGSVHLTVQQSSANKVYSNAKGVELNTISGPHPSGTIGVQVHHISPINKGEVIWHINPQDILILGKFFEKGIVDFSRTIALTGSEVTKPKYYKTVVGASIAPLLTNNITEGNLRYISGNVLTGLRIPKNGGLGFYHHQVTVIPEGNEPEFLGWALPGFNKFSFSRTFFSWLSSNKEYNVNTAYHGGHRALMITGNFEKVFPMDILPMQLIKAIIIEDIELMEKLGIYEVAEEDFALCEYIDTSKTDIQAIVRNGLDLLYKEMN